MQIFIAVTPTDLHAHAQRLPLRLPEIAVRLVGAIRFREGRIVLNSHRVEARRELRQLMFLMMCQRMRFGKSERRKRRMRPPSTPHGFGCAHRRLDMVRLSTRGIALTTFVQMRRAPDDVEQIVTRAIARVPKRISTERFVLVGSVCAPADETSSRAGAEGADTS